MNANPICMDLEHDLTCPLDQYHLQEWGYLEENRTLQNHFLFSNFKEDNHCQALVKSFNISRIFNEA